MSQLFDKKRATLPTTLQFPVPPHTDGIILNKQTVRILTSDAQSSYSGGSTMRFKLQDQKAVDLQSIVLNFRVATSSANCSVDDWIGSLFRMVSVSFNGHQIERIDHYNRLHAALAAYSVDEGYRQSIWGDMEGYYPKINSLYGDVRTYFPDIVAGEIVSHNTVDDDTKKLWQTATPNFETKRVSFWDTGSHYQNMEDGAIPAAGAVPSTNTAKGGLLNGIYLLRRFADFANADNVSRYGVRSKAVAREYSIHFDLSGFLARHRKVFWIPLVNSIDIEILLAQDGEVLNEWGVAQVAQTFTITHPHIQAEMYTLSQEYVNALSASMQERGLTLSFDTYQTRLFTLGAGLTHQVVLNIRLSSLKSMYLFFYQTIPSADANNIETKRLDKTSIQQRYLSNSASTAIVTLNDYQLFIDGRPIQAHPISTSETVYSEALWELMKSLRLHGDVSGTPLVNRDTYIARGKTTNTPNAIAATLPADNGRQPQMLSEEHFMIGVDLEKSDLLSGHSVANQLYMNLNWSGDLPPGVRMYAVLHYDKNVILYPGLVFEERV